MKPKPFEIIMEFIPQSTKTGVTYKMRQKGSLIRCKDCEYYEETDETIGTCLLTASGAHVEGYCAWAECRDEHDKAD